MKKIPPITEEEWMLCNEFNRNLPLGYWDTQVLKLLKSTISSATHRKMRLMNFLLRTEWLVDLYV